MDDRMSDKPLYRLLLEGLGEIAWIAVLVALGVLLPLPLVALGWALLLGAEWAMDRWRGKVPYRLQQALFFWVLGGGIALGQALPGFWLGLGGGLLAVIGGVLLQIRFERGLRLERQAPQALDVPLPAGGSAWGGEAPERTPEGEAIRLFDGGEIAMGGPLVCHYLMPDGCFIPDCNPSARFSSDGRHFVSPIPSRGAWGLAIFDRQERLLYRCAVDNFWELDSVTEREVIDRHSPLTSNAPQRLELQALKAGSEAEAFVAIGDLWLPESEWQRWSGDLRAQPLPSPLGGPALEIRPWLPASLLALDDPFAPLRANRGELWINGEASGLYLSREAPPLAWNDDGTGAGAAGSRRAPGAGYLLALARGRRPACAGRAVVGVARRAPCRWTRTARAGGWLAAFRPGPGATLPDLRTLRHAGFVQPFQPLPSARSRCGRPTALARGRHAAPGPVAAPGWRGRQAGMPVAERTAGRWQPGRLGVVARRSGGGARRLCLAPGRLAPGWRVDARPPRVRLRSLPGRGGLRRGADPAAAPGHTR